MAGIEAMLVTIELIAVHHLDGRVAYLNPDAIVQLAEPQPDTATNKLFVNEVNCVISLSGGRYVSVRETCAEVRKLFIDKEDKPR